MFFLVFLVVPGGMRDLGSLTQEGTCVSCTGNTESEPPDCQEVLDVFVCNTPMIFILAILSASHRGILVWGRGKWKKLDNIDWSLTDPRYPRAIVLQCTAIPRGKSTARPFMECLPSPAINSLSLTKSGPTLH